MNAGLKWFSLYFLKSIFTQNFKILNKIQMIRETNQNVLP